MFEEYYFTNVYQDSLNLIFWTKIAKQNVTKITFRKFK